MNYVECIGVDKSPSASKEGAERPHRLRWGLALSLPVNLALPVMTIAFIVSGLVANLAVAQERNQEPAAGAVRTNPVDGAAMVYIPAGEFLMGEDFIADNPRRVVKLSGYWMYRNLVTVGQYKAFSKATNRQMPLEVVPDTKHVIYVTDSQGMHKATDVGQRFCHPLTGQGFCHPWGKLEGDIESKRDPADQGDRERRAGSIDRRRSRGVAADQRAAGPTFEKEA